MKNKTKTYLLLVAVIGIWGTVAFQLINGLNPDEDIIEQQGFSSSFNPQQPVTVDSFTIQKAERDPFLGTLTSQKKKTQFSSETSKSKPIIDLPNISFGGLIKKQNSNSVVFVVTINNKQHLLKKGQEVNDVKVLSGNDKKITVRIGNQTQTIKRN